MGQQQQKPTTRLVEALEKLNDARLGDILGKAKEGFYTEDCSHPFAQTVLVMDLIHLGHRDLAIRVSRNEFSAFREDVNVNLTEENKINGKTAVPNNISEMNLKNSLYLYGLDAEQVNQISEIVKVLSKLKMELTAAQKIETEAREKPRCNGHEHWDKEIYLYANHSVNDRCPLHGSNGDKRVRKYIGTDKGNIEECKAAMQNYRYWKKTKTAVNEIDMKLGILKDSLKRLYESRNGRSSRRWDYQ